MYNVLFRITVSFIVLWILIRVLGKRHAGEVTYYNIAVSGAFGAIAGAAATDVNTALVYICLLL